MFEKVLPNIRRAYGDRGVQGEHYVSWGEGSFVRYLHSDGIWRNKTVSESGQFTGYFPSKQAAQAAVDRYVR